MGMNKKIQLLDWGLTEYENAFEKQNALFEDIVRIKIKNKQENLTLSTPNYFIFTEHPHVYTLGKSGKEEHLLLPGEELEKLNVRFIKTNRGGDITYHGPGQIVGYPIVDLDNFKIDIIAYIRNLEEVIIRVLKHFDLKGERIPGETGVWIDAQKPSARKICAIGVRTSRWVTMHGFAFNLNPDLNYFKYIIPCGIKNKGVTSLEAELGYCPKKEKVKNLILDTFLEVFRAELF